MEIGGMDELYIEFDYAHDRVEPQADMDICNHKFAARGLLTSGNSGIAAPLYHYKP
jgi:hypothetical protein